MTLILIPLFLCWGSFLNFFAHRLVSEKNLLSKRSVCPKCKKSISWYDTIPVISWIILKGHCRKCNKKISALYPFIEIFTATSLLLLYKTVEPSYFFSYFIFFSALIVSIRSDLETMLLSRFVTIYLVPLGLTFSWLGLLPITPLNSILGVLLGYGFLLLMSKIFYFFTKKEGLGQGDLELLAFIGSFLGIIGCWISLLLGSVVGSIIGILYIYIKKQSKTTPIPFGPFLAFGAICFVLFEEKLKLLLLGM